MFFDLTRRVDIGEVKVRILYRIFIYFIMYLCSERWRRHNLTSIARRSQPSRSIASLPFLRPVEQIQYRKAYS
jgi:hypothetical protein